jgi:hypothetical protein
MICPFCNKQLSYYNFVTDLPILKCDECINPGFFTYNKYFYVSRMVESVRWKIVYHSEYKYYSLCTFDTNLSLPPKSINIDIAIIDNDTNSALKALDKVIKIRVFL